MIKHMATAALICAIQYTSFASAEEALDPEQLFKEAMELRNSGQIVSAIKVFETIINQQPGLNRARLELAIAYHQAQKFNDARDQLTKVLNDPETPDPVKLAVTGYLAQLGSDEKTAKKRTSSSVYVSAGLFTDSNVNLGPSTELNGATLERSGSGIITMASFSHVSRASKPFKSGDSLVNFEWNTQASIYDKSYTSSGDSDFNLQVVSLSTGPALVSEKNWSVQFNIKLDQVFFGGDAYSSNVGLNPKLTLNFADALQIFAEALSTVREFSNSTDQGLDGTSNMYGIGASKFFNNQTIGIDGGLRYHSNGADDSDLNASGLEIYMSIQTPAWNNARTYLELSSRQYEYETGTPTIRDETEQRFIAGVSHDFKTSALKGWTLNGQLSLTQNDSNDSNFEYDRNVLEVNLRRYF